MPFNQSEDPIKNHLEKKSAYKKAFGQFDDSDNDLIEVFKDLEEQCHMNTYIFNPGCNALDTVYLEGQRSVFLYILKCINYELPKED